MTDFLTYRIPGEEIVTLYGSFLPINEPKIFNGFLVTDFKGENFYGFIENQVPPILENRNLSPFVISKEEYLQQANQLIAELKSGACEKIILSRVKKIEKSQTEPTELFQSLENQYPNAFCYCFQSSLLGTWIGASPEKLISLDGGYASTSSLAGTKKIEDKSPWGNKEIHEQAIVTSYVSEIVNEFSKDNYQSESQELIAGPVKHLHTQFNFKLNRADLFSFLKQFHPTPAVCGLPKSKALTVISKTEKHNRKIYAGFIGINAISKTNLYVNLRCCQFIKKDYFLYVGGGFTKDSIAELEWNETENKALTILNFLQIE